MEPKKINLCPLCKRKWKIVEESGKTGQAFFVCLWCEISTWVRDPMVGLWDQFEKVKCTICSNMMNFFCRSDEYCKWYCPKCKTTIETHDPEKHKKLNPEKRPEDIEII
jgi:phage FluMu protein Com